MPELLRALDPKLADVPLLVDTFLGEYFREMDPDIEKRIPLYEAMTHVRRACKKLRFQRPRWEKKIERMIGHAVECIDRM